MFSCLTRVASVLGIVLVQSLANATASPAIGTLAATQDCVIAGPAQARITIEEFSDFECPYCAKGAKTIKEILKKYPGQVRLIFRNLPLSSHLPNSLVAAKAMAAICQMDPKKAFSFQEEIFSHQDRLMHDGQAYVSEVAQQLAVDESELRKVMESAEVATQIQLDRQLADAHAFRGTPSFMIGNEPVVGSLPLAEFSRVIDRQLGQ
jgi:protein-disulfide isomerase